MSEGWFFLVLLNFCWPISSLFMNLKFATMLSSESPLSLSSEERQGRNKLNLLIFEFYCRLLTEDFLSWRRLLVFFEFPDNLISFCCSVWEIYWTNCPIWEVWNDLRRLLNGWCKLKPAILFGYFMILRTPGVIGSFMACSLVSDKKLPLPSLASIDLIGEPSYFFSSSK